MSVPMTFEEWFEEAWRTGALAHAEYKHEARMAAQDGWNGAIDAVIVVLENMTRDQEDEGLTNALIRALKS